MSALLNKIANDDFIWNAISAHLPKHRRSATAFSNFNCPMCMDYKPRCGVKRSNRIGVSCFNCGFNTGYKVGQPLSKKLADFLRRIGVPDLEVKRLALQARAIRRALEDTTVVPPEIEAITFEPNFPRMELPEGALPLTQWADMGCTDPDFLRATEYALSRGDVIMQRADFHWTPVTVGKYDMAKRLIIPFRWHDKIVGYTARTIDGHADKYLNFMPANYLFNSQVMDGDREYVLLIEGPLDALAIDGVSPIGSRLNEKQVAWIKACGKKVITVPDRDKAGDKMITLARKHGWAVAFPGLGGRASDWWDDDIKDCDEAVKRHGRLYVLKSIIETATVNATEIEIKRRHLV